MFTYYNKFNNSYLSMIDESMIQRHLVCHVLAALHVHGPRARVVPAVVVRAGTRTTPTRRGPRTHEQGAQRQQ